MKKVIMVVTVMMMVVVMGGCDAVNEAYVEQWELGGYYSKEEVEEKLDGYYSEGEVNEMLTEVMEMLARDKYDLEGEFEFRLVLIDSREAGEVEGWYEYKTEAYYGNDLFTYNFTASEYYPIGGFLLYFKNEIGEEFVLDLTK